MNERNLAIVLGIVGIILLVGFSLLMLTPCVSAELIVDEYFEKSRGELIGFYGSEIVSHVALILGSLVAVATLVSNLNDFWNDQQPSLKKRVIFILVLGLILCAVFYSGLKLVYWSAMGAYVMDATSNKTMTFLNTNITSSNATSWTPILQEYAMKNLGNEPAIYYKLALLSTFIWSQVALFVCPAIVSIIYYIYHWHNKCRKPNEKFRSELCCVSPD